MTRRSAEDLRLAYPALIGRSGGFTMLANDQRESLRSIIAGGRAPEAVSDDEIVAFKRAVTRTLSGHASAILLDREYGITATTADDLAPGCGLILAADILHQLPGGPVTGSSIDPGVTAEVIRASGAVAIKLLVVWRDGADTSAEEDMIARFTELAREAGVASLVEGIARPVAAETWTDPDAREDAILRAADAIDRFRPDIYKAEVPGYRRGDVSGVRAASEAITEVLTSPWVVLSNGVDPVDFPAAVEAAVAGGADGFLAGRAVWADAATASRPDSVLADSGVRRLAELEAIVAERHSGVTIR